MDETVMMTMPFAVLHGFLNQMVHKQFDARMELLSVYPQRILALFLFVHFTHKYAKSWLMQLFLICVASVCSVWVIYITREDETFGAMQKAPGLAVLWIYAAVQLNLSSFLPSLLIPLVYYFKDELQQLASGKGTRVEL